MTQRIKTTLATAALAAGLFMNSQAGAQSFAMQINGVTCMDNAGCDMDPTVNQIAWLASVSGFSFTLVSSLTNTPGTAPASSIDMGWNISTGSTGAGGAIQILASATGFTFPVTGQTSVLNNEIGGTTQGSVSGSAQSWASAANSLFAMSGTTAGALAIAGSPFALSNQLAFVATTPYSLTQALNFTIGRGGQTSGDFETTSVPEPAPLALFAIALGALALVRRRNRG